MVAKVVEGLGGLDVVRGFRMTALITDLMFYMAHVLQMVANAGIVLFKSILDTQLEEWDRMMLINVRGVMLCYKYAAVQMIKQGRGGRIIGASSVAGKTGVLNLSAYCASKFAVRGITQSAALEFAPHNITVNAYCPGGMNTPMGSFAHASVDDSHKQSPFGDPEVIASIVSYLAKPESYFITGQSVVVDGGTVFD
ncbi:hypothetical protein AcV7_008598 [Taiwanofungus camphoratus]|nr:hypothetical protein AcV7_008598 [Antrodia cinnamomea]